MVLKESNHLRKVLCEQPVTGAFANVRFGTANDVARLNVSLFSSDSSCLLTSSQELELDVEREYQKWLNKNKARRDQKKAANVRPS